LVSASRSRKGWAIAMAHDPHQAVCRMWWP
jgi:hypothetical protein